MICVGTYGKRKENLGFEWNLLKTKGKQRFPVGTDRKNKENTCVAWKPKENARKTHVLRVNLLNTYEKHWFCMKLMETL